MLLPTQARLLLVVLLLLVLTPAFSWSTRLVRLLLLAGGPRIPFWVVLQTKVPFRVLPVYRCRTLFGTENGSLISRKAHTSDDINPA